jgi:sec-independent protein translocase protein TatC
MPLFEDREMELWEHLSELRTRIMRSLIYLVIGTIICWWFYPILEEIVKRPLAPLEKKIHIEYVYIHITQPFMLKLQVSVIGGLILAVPFLTLELWGFVAPGLTREERRGFYFVIPLSVFFFFLGIVTAYMILPTTFAYFATFIPERPPGAGAPGQSPMIGSGLMQNPLMLWTFVMKMILAFGVVFQMPVVLMGMAWAGIVTTRMLKKNWRVAIVLCSVVAAVATPSTDPASMIMMAAPLLVLYLTSIWLVGIVEKIRAKKALAAPSYEPS